MILQIKFKVKLYRRFEKDIWGLSLTKLEGREKYLLFLKKLFLFKQALRKQAKGNFTYDGVFRFKRHDRKKMKKGFLSLRVLKLHFLTLSYRQFIILAKVAARREGFFQSNFCHRLEGRASSIIYRSNLVGNMFMAVHLVTNSAIWVNKKLISAANYLVQIGDLVSLAGNYFHFFRHHLVLRFTRRAVFFSPPRYMVISYKLFLIMMVEYPKDHDLAFPTKIDIYRLTRYN